MKKIFAVVAALVLLMIASSAFAVPIPVKTIPDSALQAEGDAVIAVVTYEHDAERLISVHDQAAAKCRSGKLDKKKCARINELYQTTRDLYIWQGDKLELYLIHRDPRSGEKYIEIKTRYEKSRDALFKEIKKFKITE